MPDRNNPQSQEGTVPELTPGEAAIDAERGRQQKRAEEAEDRLKEVERQRDEAREERDLAIAHDRQPYPTADAYEKVCAARTKWQERAEKAEAELETLRKQMKEQLRAR